MNYQAQKQLEEALQLIPDQEKAAYLEAVEKVPQLVQLESDPLRFLRREDYNAWAASRRLVTYWETRKTIFGDKAFLPMSQTEEGALSKEDLDVLNTGALVLLPNDNKGRSVIFFDRSKLRPDMYRATEPRLRCAFYLLSIAAEQESAQTEGIVALALAVRPPGAGYDFVYARRTIEMCRDALPIRIKAIHFLSLPSTTGRGALMETVVKMCLQMVGSFLKYAQVHRAEAEQDLLPELKALGLVKKDIPVEIGGNWKLEKFEIWKKRRIRAEEDWYMTEQQKLDRKRRVNVIHSRQKRQRRKIEFEVVQEQVLHLSQQNANLYRQNMELEKILEMAQNEVALIEGRGDSSHQEEATVPPDATVNPEGSYEPQVALPPSLAASGRSALPSSSNTAAPSHPMIAVTCAPTSAASQQAALAASYSVADPNKQDILGQLIAQQQKNEQIQRSLLMEGLLLDPASSAWLHNPQLRAATHASHSIGALHPNSQMDSLSGTSGMPPPQLVVIPPMLATTHHVAYPALPGLDESSSVHGYLQHPDAASARVAEALALQQREISLARALAADHALPTVQQRQQLRGRPPPQPSILVNLGNVPYDWLGALTTGASNMFRTAAPGPSPSEHDGSESS